MKIAMLEPLEPRELFAAGKIDGSFGNHGIAKLSPVPTTDELFDAQRPDFFSSSDGRVIVAGTTDFHQPFLRRFFPNGSVDGTFPQPQLKNLPENFGDQTPFARQKDGGILFGAETSPEQATLLRVTPRGSLDRHFGNNGVANLPVREEVTAIGVLPDGRIVASGIVNAFQDPDTGAGAGTFGICVLSANGKVDTHFGQHGVVRLGEFHQVDDDFEADTIALGGEQFVPLPGGKFMYLRNILRSERDFDLDGNAIADLNFSEADAHVFNSDGTLDSHFKFDRTRALGPDRENRWFLNGARRAKDGSVQFEYVLNETSPHEQKPVYDAFLATMEPDGTIHSKRIARNIFSPFAISLPQTNGDILLQTAERRLMSFRPDGTVAASILTDGRLRNATLTDAAIADDGELLATYFRVVNFKGSALLVRLRLQ